MTRLVISKTCQFSPARKIGSVSGLGSPFPPVKDPCPPRAFKRFSPSHNLIFNSEGLVFVLSRFWKCILD